MAYIGRKPTNAPLTSSDIADGIISTADLANTAVTGAKVNTDVISAQTALATEPADTDEFLVSDAGVIKRIDYSLIKGGGTHVKISTTTISSGVTSLDITGLDSTYQSYMVELNGLITASDNVDLKMNWIQGGSTVTTSNHRSQCVRFGISEGVTNILSTSNASYMRLCAGLGNNTGFTANGRLFIYGSQNSASNTQYQSEFSIGHYDNNDEQMHLCHGRIDVATTTTGFTISTSTGNMTAGTFRLYGIL